MSDEFLSSLFPSADRVPATYRIAPAIEQRNLATSALAAIAL